MQVRAGIPTIELTTASAEKMEGVVETPVAAPPAPTRDNGMDDEIVAKDPAMATMLSFFLTGTGHMYSGERYKGAGLLALTAVGVGVAAKQLSCAAVSDCESTTGGRALGAAGMVAFFGSWLYGILDAGDAARRFNGAHGLRASRQSSRQPRTGGHAWVFRWRYATNAAAGPSRAVASLPNNCGKAAS